MRLLADPPEIAPPPELEWVVRRAFGPLAGGLLGEQVDGHAALALARSFDLSARIGSRWPLRVIDRDLGSEAAVAFVIDHFEAAKRALSLARVCREIAAITAGFGTSAIFLKGMAGHLAGVTPLGSRSIGDIDVLVPDRYSWALQRALLVRGFDEVGCHHSEHHLGLLVNAEGMIVEVHERVGLTGRCGARVVAQELIDEGQLTEVEIEGERALVPREEFQVAHAIHHALVQDRAERHMSVTFSRMLTDLADRDFADEAWDDMRPALERYLSPRVSWQEVSALRALQSHLARGALVSEVAGIGGLASAMMRRWVLGATSEDFVETLAGRPTLLRRLRRFSLAPRVLRRRYEPEGLPRWLGEIVGTAAVLGLLPFRAARGVFRVARDSQRYRSAVRRLTGGARGISARPEHSGEAGLE